MKLWTPEKEKKLLSSLAVPVDQPPLPSVKDRIKMATERRDQWQKILDGLLEEQKNDEPKTSSKQV